MIVRVNVPDAAIEPLPLTKVWKLPRLEPVGVFKLVDPKPVNVIINALPMPPRKVTEFEPLPEQPPHVKVPDVVNVTGSAFAVEAPIAMKPASTAVTTIVFMNRVMFDIPLSNAAIRLTALRSNGVFALRSEQTITLLGT